MVLSNPSRQVPEESGFESETQILFRNRIIAAKKFDSNLFTGQFCSDFRTEKSRRGRF